MLVFAMIATGFLISFVLSRWISSGVIAVLLSAFLATAAVAGGFYYWDAYVAEPPPAGSQRGIAFGTLFLMETFGAILGRVLAEIHARRKTKYPAGSAHTPA